jgi:hypothetical protein
MPLPLCVYADNKHFPKNSVDINVKIYETAQLVLWSLNQKTNINVSVANVLWVAFSIPSGSLSLGVYRVYQK